LRVLARLVENKSPATFNEHDAEHLREAAEEIERLRECVLHNLDDRHKAVAAERAAILEMIEPLNSDVETDRRYGVAVLRDLVAAIKARGTK
jgi:hypothetical protein